MSELSLMEKAGITIPTNLTDNKIQTVFDATGLNWHIIQKQVYTDNGPIKGVVANYRSDNNAFLGCVNAKKYNVVTNLEAFNFIDELPNFTLEKVGAFNGGKKVFVVGKSSERFCIDGSDDMVDFYLTFLHGHDGKSGIRFILCPIRMFCMNQLNLMLESAKFKYSITHTGDVAFKLNQIQRAIANSNIYVDNLKSYIDGMINTKPTVSIEKFVELLLPEEEVDTKRQITYKDDVRNAIIDLYTNKDDLQNYKNTNFGILSAVSDYISHANPRRSGSVHTINNAFVSNMEGNELLERAKQILQLAA